MRQQEWNNLQKLNSIHPDMVISITYRFRPHGVVVRATSSVSEDHCSIPGRVIQ